MPCPHTARQMSPPKLIVSLHDRQHRWGKAVAVTCTWAVDLLFMEREEAVDTRSGGKMDREKKTAVGESETSGHFPAREGDFQGSVDQKQ